jgi:outer membrane protein insertion porin family
MPYEATEIGISERFFVGGTSSLRGFKPHGVGPRDDGDDDIAIGGATRVTQRHELRYPIKEKFLIGRVFTDAAILEKGPLEPGVPRIGSGVGAMIDFGPLSAEVDLGAPVLKDSDDEAQFFHLRLGSNF